MYFIVNTEFNTTNGHFAW